ncbi:MAG: YrdB family protein [Prolixibacteraceae bacterium]|jgi:predicted membrane protein
MDAVKQANLLLSFLLELVLLFLVGCCGFQAGETLVLKYVFAFFLPTVIIVLWGIWAAPKSKRRLKNPVRTIFKLTLFFVGALLVYLFGNQIWAIVFAAIVVLNAGLALLFGQDY